jgi:3-hydroxybutyryl-CoA dehydrogenase
MAEEIAELGVVGAGFMGSGIAESAARAGVAVKLYEPEHAPLEHSRGRIEASVARVVERGRLSESDAATLMEHIEWSTDIESLAGVDLVVEAIVEDEQIKAQTFRQLDSVVPSEVILASNTSSIPITSLAAATGRPERVVGMHFFNPVPVLRLVEVIRGLQTSDETAAAVVELARDLGKEPAEARDFPGFVSNRILMPFINEAAYALMEGVAEPEAIDTIAKLGFAHPMGPLALADLIGLDTCVAIMEVLHAGLGQDKYAPCPLLRQYVQAGRLGRKSGRGFYEYASV